VTAKTVKIAALFLTVLPLFPQGLASRAADAPNEPSRSTAQAPNSIFTRDPNVTFGTDQQFETSGMFWRMMLAVLMVLVMGVAAYYMSRRLGGRIINLPSRQIRLVETLYLGSRKALHLIKVGDRSILVATTPTAVTRIADLDQVTGGSTAANEPK
jgi:flagellar biogenesis protein FliO